MDILNTMFKNNISNLKIDKSDTDNTAELHKFYSENIKDVDKIYLPKPVLKRSSHYNGGDIYKKVKQ
tara:strand:- start:2117 stop:2317 length:201 start_codon:yes stop_codon:yes gene_type:complete